MLFSRDYIFRIFALKSAASFICKSFENYRLVFVKVFEKWILSGQNKLNSKFLVSFSVKSKGLTNC